MLSACFVANQRVAGYSMVVFKEELGHFGSKFGGGGDIAPETISLITF